jgi:glycerol uptake facilitator-like aquaporin
VLGAVPVRLEAQGLINHVEWFTEPSHLSDSPAQGTRRGGATSMAAKVGERLGAELLGSAILTGAVVGSGVMAERLAGGNLALALLGNTLATAAILFVLLTALAPVSGAHFNPAVTLAAMLRRDVSVRAALAYMLAQTTGCLLGVLLAHAMFALPLLQAGVADRGGVRLMLSEAVATFMLVLTVLVVSRRRPDQIAPAVALVIASGYWWTASTSFANPAITIARAFTETFSGLRLEDAPGFVAAQIGGALLALLAVAGLRLDRDQAPPTDTAKEYRR